MLIQSFPFTSNHQKHASFKAISRGEDFFSSVNSDVLTISNSENPSLVEAAKNRIFTRSDTQIRGLLKKYSPKIYDKKDVYQDLMLKFFEMLETLKSSENPAETFKNFFKNLTPAPSSRVLPEMSTMDRTIFRDSTLTVGENAIETIFDREIALDFTSEEKAVRKETISSLLKNPKNSEKDIKILSLHFNEDNKNTRISKTARELNLSPTQTKNYLDRAIVHLQSNNGMLPKEAQEFISEFKKNFPEAKLSTKEILNIYVKNGSIPPQKAAENAQILADYFKSPYFTKKSYAGSFKYFPALYFQPPQKTIENIEGVIKALEPYGLTKEKYLKALYSQPQYYQAPETINSNIAGLAKLYSKYGMTMEKAVSSAIKFPRLFFQSPEKPGQKAQEMEKLFKKEGLSAETYFKAMMKSPFLFCFSTEHARENILKSSQLLESTGLTLKDFIEIAMKQPTAITQRPELVSEHIRLVQYIRKDDRVANGLAPMNKRELVAASSSLPLGYSKENSFLCFLNKKIARCLGEKCLLNINLKEKLPQRLAEINTKSFHFDIVEGEFAQEFIDFVKEFSQKHFGKNIFKINIVQELKDGAELFKYLK